MSAQTDLAKRLREACDGWPHAKIAWPHRLLHEAAEAILELQKDVDRFAWLLQQPASVQDAVLHPPIPPELLESPEKWPDLVRAAIDTAKPINLREAMDQARRQWFIGSGLQDKMYREFYEAVVALIEGTNEGS